MNSHTNTAYSPERVAQIAPVSVSRLSSITRNQDAVRVEAIRRQRAMTRAALAAYAEGLAGAGLADHDLAAPPDRRSPGSSASHRSCSDPRRRILSMHRCRSR